MKPNVKKIYFGIAFVMLCCVPRSAYSQSLQPDTSGGFVTEPQQYVVPANKIRVIRIVAAEILAGEISVIAVNEQKYSLELTKEIHVPIARRQENMQTIFSRPLLQSRTP